MARDEGPQLRNRLRTTRARTLCRDGGNQENASVAPRLRVTRAPLPANPS